MSTSIPVPRILNLALPDDVKELRNALRDNERLLKQVDDSLEDYFRYCRHDEWKIIYSGGVIGRDAPTGRGFGTDLLRVLELTAKLRELEPFAGFPSFIERLDSTSQLSATFFEIESAFWCAKRAVTKSLEFEPRVEIKGSIKRPDFLWKTTLGDLYSECKTTSTFDSDIGRKIRRFDQIIDDELGDGAPWKGPVRLDIVLADFIKNGVEQRLRKIVREATSLIREDAEDSRELVEGEITATLRPKSIFRPDTPCSVTSLRTIVTDVPTPLDDSSAYLTLTLSTKRHQVRAVSNALRDARTQLPLDGNGAMLLEVKNTDLVLDRVLSMMDVPSYRNTPWTALFSSSNVRAVYRDDQPFDDRLLEGSA